jgi:hypothetical protein
VVQELQIGSTRSQPLFEPADGMRFLVKLLIGGLVVFAVAGSARAQLGYDRPGANYRSFTIRSGDPAVCASDCCISGVRGAGVIEPRRGSVEYSIDRYGGDYRGFKTKVDPAGAPCRKACEADHRCRAWTYARPGYFRPSARCHLKNKIPRPRRKPCCISGVVR